MKGVTVILRSVVVSLELLVCVAGVGMCVAFPGWFYWLSERIGQQADVLKYAGLLPAGLVAYDLKVARSILLPDADKRTILQAWPRYWEFKCVVVAGLVYGVLFGVVGLATMLFDWKSPEAYQSAALLTAVAGAVTVAASLFHGNLRVEELFREHWKQKSSG